MTSKTDSLPKGRLDCDEDFLRGYHVGYRRGSFHDGERLGFEHGYQERRIQAAIRCRDEIQDMIMERTEDNDSEDDEDTKRKQDIMDDIELLTQPNEKLTKENLKQLVDAYRNCENDFDNDSEDTDQDSNDETDKEDDDFTDEEDDQSTDEEDNDNNHTDEE